MPIRKANARTILKEFKERIVLRFGTPEVFLSDNGTEFKNRAVDEYLEGIGVYHSTTPPYHPQANPVERVNRTLKTRLTAFVENSHAEWDEKLPELAFSLNNAVHSSTGVTPAVLNYGRQPLPPATTRRAQERAALEQRETEARDSWLDRLKDLGPVKKRAATKSAEEHQRQATYYDARRREVKYEVGDLVMKRNRILSSAAQGISAKLAPKYAGPLRITEVTGSNTVKIVDEHGKNEEVLHVSHLKPLNDAAESSDVSVAEEDDIEEPQPPREATSDPVMSDPPEIGVAPPNATRSARNVHRGVRGKRFASWSARDERKRAKFRKRTSGRETRGRPKGSKNRVEPTAEQNVSPPSTLAQRLAARRRSESDSE